jgi:arylsulfatase A-like enzyme
METIDDETTQACIDFITKQKNAGKPFFAWMNFTRMHAFTHVRESMRGQAGMPGNEYADGMIEMDNDVGKLLKAVDDLGIADNTMVVFTTDNGPNQWSWPDAATTPFRSEKDTNWEGAFRVPAVIRWPGHVKPGSVSNDIVSGLDWFPTILAAAGDATVKERLLKGWAPKPAGRPTRSIWTATTSSRTSRARRSRPDASSTTSTTTECSWRCASTTSRLSSASSGSRRLRGLVESVHVPARAEGIQLAHGSLRARRRRLGPVLRLVGQERLRVQYTCIV